MNLTKSMLYAITTFLILALLITGLRVWHLSNDLKKAEATINTSEQTIRDYKKGAERTHETLVMSNGELKTQIENLKITKQELKMLLAERGDYKGAKRVSNYTFDTVVEGTARTDSLSKIVVDLLYEKNALKRRLKSLGIIFDDAQAEALYWEQEAACQDYIAKSAIHSRFTNENIDITIDASEDSTNFKLAIPNDIAFVTERKREKWYDFSKKTIVSATNTNPYTTNAGINSLEVFDKRKITVGVNASYGVTATGELLPTIGIGLQYPLIKF